MLVYRRVLKAYFWNMNKRYNIGNTGKAPQNGTWGAKNEVL